MTWQGRYLQKYWSFARDQISKFDRVTTAKDKYKMRSSRPRLKACRPKLIIRNTALLYNLGKVLFKVRDTSFLQTTVKNVDPPCCHLTSRPRPNGRGFPGKPLRDLCSPSMARNVVQTPNAAHLANLASIFFERSKKRFKTLGGRTDLLRYTRIRDTLTHWSWHLPAFAACARVISPRY